MRGVSHCGERRPTHSLTQEGSIMVKSLDHHWAPAAEANSEGDDEAAAPKLEQLADEVGDDVTQADLDTAEPDVELSTAVGKGVNGRGKALLSSYEPDNRCESWLKVKKDYVDGIGDTLDLVPIGAWHGMGRKNEWWSPGE
jgi:DNA ligase-1